MIKISSNRILRKDTQHNISIWRVSEYQFNLKQTNKKAIEKTKQKNTHKKKQQPKKNKTNNDSHGDEPHQKRYIGIPDWWVGW